MCKTNYACFLKCYSCCASKNERRQQKVERDKVLNEAKIKINRDSENDIENESLAATTSSKEKRQFRAIILDCTRCNFIDESGAKCLKEIVDTYAKENVRLLLTNCNGNVLFVSFLK
jgi:hypothetical protein